MSAEKEVWPDYLMIRDTGLHDDMGGLGQRIHTTAGAGYKKVKYVRADIAERDAAEIGRLRGEVAMTEQQKADRDLLLTGTSFMRDGKRIDPATVRIETPAPAMPNGVEASREQFNAWMKTRGVISSWHVQQDMWNAWTASRAADNHDAAGVVPAWIATWMADREILPDDDGDGISEGALVEALNNHERELLNAHPSACELGADGVGLIAAERQRQVSVEGWTTVHDDGHELGEMARAASCYAMPDGWRHQLVKLCWPWDATWWKPGDRIRELVKAGALVAAEIDRLQRAALQHRGDSQEVGRG